ncbi:RNA-metabolising metallo-beta-lactamase family protein [Tritrichomonas foetus]|uniref:RNA-metabolising metallo-beta-lactamase family protein n=1 Tax=Tritrichomonas foetus TaxID=1144522 RepID=A0A1J4JP54_9EUKA|nr:RNA-metabolising metallo-beta-lactamase family protein [Tritrichomonas foetus]|eukprot:OHT00200.1 RNA-metabolising metallo-beta-lactamase family protein [Tritrichomonas foetus]
MEEIQIGDDILTIMPLGAGQEVGRSCIIVKYRKHTIMLDCGIHPGYMETAGLPYFDAIDPADIDLLLITHFHIDHCAAVPWFLMQTGFHGKCYMTPLTKAIFKILLQDYVRVSSGNNNDQSLFNKVDLDNCLPLISPANFRQVITYNGIKITCYRAGHVLGACMWMIDIDGVRILYTGDFSLEDERHLKGAEIPPISPDVLIIESTHGITRNEHRADREYRFIDYVTKIVMRGGRCLIPIFALGRVQELLLILEECWESRPNLQNIPIYFGSNLTKKSMFVYNAFEASLNDSVISGKARFDFKYITYIKSVEEIDDSLSCVVLAAPAMLQNGMSRTIFDKWASNPLNGVIIPGYTVDNTLAKDLFTEPKEVPTMSGQKIPRRLTVHNVSFSGHSDFTHTSKFIEALKTKRIVLIHGVYGEMERLRERLKKDFAYFEAEVYSPGDCEPVTFEFKSNPTAVINGKLLEAKDHISGLIVRKDYSHMIVAPNELSSYSTLKIVGVEMRQQIPVNRPLIEFKNMLSQYFDDVTMVENSILTIGSFIKLEQKSDDLVTLEWRTDPMSDMVADNISMMLTCTDPAKIDQDIHETFALKLQLALQSRWGNDIMYDSEAQIFQFTINGNDVLIAMDPDAPNGIAIECENQQISDMISKIARKLYEFVKPMSLPTV